jgi:hypothetical protein
VNLRHDSAARAAEDDPQACDGGVWGHRDRPAPAVTAAGEPKPQPSTSDHMDRCAATVRSDEQFPARSCVHWTGTEVRTAISGLWLSESLEHPATNATVAQNQARLPKSRRLLTSSTTIGSSIGSSLGQGIVSASHPRVIGKTAHVGGVRGRFRRPMSGGRPGLQRVSAAAFIAASQAASDWSSMLCIWLGRRQRDRPRTTHWS